MLLVVVLCLVSSSGSQRLATIRSDHDIFGERLACNDHVVALAINDVTRYDFFFNPLGPNYYCPYDYFASQNFVVSLAIGERQSADDTSFVYLRTDEETEDYLELGIFRINRTQCLEDPDTRPLFETPIHRFNLSLDGLVSVLQVDFYGQYAYGFLEEFAYILDIAKKNVTILDWKTILPNVTKLYPKDAHVTRTRYGMDLIVLVGYFTVNLDGTLPAVYLLHAEPPFRLSLLYNETLITDQTVGGTFAFSYEFDYVMSVSIEHETQQVLIALPYYEKTFLYQFNETHLSRTRVFSKAARSVAWFDRGTQAALLLPTVPALPWASSQVQVIDTTTADPNVATFYAMPNNQQTIPFARPTQLPQFIRLDISDGQPVILASNGLIINAPIAPPGHYVPLVEISSYADEPHPCPNGTFRTTFSPSPCLVCPTGYRNSNLPLSRSRRRE